MSRIVITGGTGMLGRALTQRFLEEGAEVVLLVRPGSKRLDGMPISSRLKMIPCDISNLGALAEDLASGGKMQEEFAALCGTCDIFYHLGWAGTFGASRNDMFLQNLNVRYTLDAVFLAHRLGCKTFVGAGSQAEYGRVEGKLSADTPTNPENGYGMAKLCAGQMSRVLCQEKGIKHVWTRILSVYGPHDGLQTMVTSSIASLLAGARPRFTPCEQRWDYLYCDDAARALQLAGEKGKDGSVYCIGSGVARPLSDYVSMLRDAVDPNADIGIGDLPYNDKQVMYLCADISNLQEDTGFKPLIDFKEGIARTVAWVKTLDRER